MSEMFEDIEGVEVVVDEILVWGENKQQHDDRLLKILERACLQNLRQALEENFHVNALSIVPMFDKKLAQLKEATQTDSQLPGRPASQPASLPACLP